MKKILYLFFFVFLIFPSFSYAKDWEWAKKDWSSRFERNKVFYTTHGTVIWGHEFGFFKPTGYCDTDTIWITISSINNEVLNFKRKDVLFMIEVDGRPFKINLNMIDAEKFTPTLNIMMFTNSDAGEDLIAILNKGRKLTLKIIGPKELVKYIDIDHEEFSLNGFIATRLKAKVMCDMVTLK